MRKECKLTRPIARRTPSPSSSWTTSRSPSTPPTPISPPSRKSSNPEHLLSCSNRQYSPGMSSNATMTSTTWDRFSIIARGTSLTTTLFGSLEKHQLGIRMWNREWIQKSTNETGPSATPASRGLSRSGSLVDTIGEWLRKVTPLICPCTYSHRKTVRKSWCCQEYCKRAGRRTKARTWLTWLSQCRTTMKDPLFIGNKPLSSSLISPPKPSSIEARTSSPTKY